jgi:hypothetical protein
LTVFWNSSINSLLFWAISPKFKYLF